MRVFLDLLLPTFLVHLTRALMLTTLPLFVLQTLQESKSYAGIAVGAIGLGKVVSDVPAGILLQRIGARHLMIVCGLTICASALLMLLASQNKSFILVVIAMVLCGTGESVGVISRLATVSDEVPAEDRGRVSAYLGGSMRIAMAVGPLYSGIAVNLTGSADFVFVTQAILAMASVLVVFSARTASPPLSNQQPVPAKPVGIRHLTTVLFHVSVFILALQLLRECRKLLVPLAAFPAGLSISDISIFTSISFTIDALLFPYAGKVMDGYGRVFAGVFSMSVMTLSLLMIVPALSFYSLLIAAIGTGIGNGISSGIIVAFGADLAPQNSSRSQFLGYFRLCADIGELVGPLIVGVVSQFSSIASMVNTVAAVGCIGSFWLIKFVPDTGWGKFASSPVVPSSPMNLKSIGPNKPFRLDEDDDDEESPFT
jgi:MFS family permease